VGPGPREIFPPTKKGRRVDDRRLLSDTIGVADVYRVIVTVPCDKDCGGRVIPANVYSSDFRPVGGDLDGFFGNGVV
jgi:hypothetical protein